MNTNWKECKEQYEDIEIPVELNQIIQMEIEKDQKKIQRNQKWKFSTGKTAAAAAVFLIAFTGFTGMVNFSPEIAMAMYKVPVLGSLAKVVTFREYQFEDKELEVNIKIPGIQDTGNTELERKINAEIEEKVEAVLNQAKKQSKEYNEQLQKMEGMEEEVRQFDVVVDYEKKYSDEKILSFVVYKLVNGPSADPKNYYYNMDLETGMELKLKDVLKENWRETANKCIREQIQQRMAEDESQVFFGTNQEDLDLGIKGFQTVSEDQTFYINEKGNVVVTFDKYEIAPGYMGMPEFEIEQ